MTSLRIQTAIVSGLILNLSLLVFTRVIPGLILQPGLEAPVQSGHMEVDSMQKAEHPMIELKEDLKHKLQK